MANIYVNGQGNVYKAASPNSAGDSLVLVPTPELLAAATGVPVALSIVHAAAWNARRSSKDF